MKKTARKPTSTEGTRPQLCVILGELAREEAAQQLTLGLKDLVRENLREFVISAELAALTAVLEAYREARARWIAGDAIPFPIGTYWLRRFAHVPLAS